MKVGLAKVKAVLFDLDGVIVDSAKYHFLAWQSLAAELSISIDKEFNEQLKGVSRIDSLKKILAHGKCLEKFSEKQIQELATKKNQVYVDMVQKMTKGEILPGIEALLSELREKNYKIALASASKNGPLILNLLGITNYFDVIVNPEKVETGKPAPDIFLKAAELVRVDPNDCVGIEDAVSGVMAIKAAKMTAIAVGSSMQFKQADCVVSSTKELCLDLIINTWNDRTVSI